jgi:hypothetical protein
MTKRWNIGKRKFTLVLEKKWVSLWWRNPDKNWDSWGFTLWEVDNRDRWKILTFGGEGLTPFIFLGFCRNDCLEDFYTGSYINPPRWDLFLFGKGIRGRPLIHPGRFPMIKKHLEAPIS